MWSVDMRNHSLRHLFTPNLGEIERGRHDVEQESASELLILGFQA